MKNFYYSGLYVYLVLTHQEKWIMFQQAKDSSFTFRIFWIPFFWLRNNKNENKCNQIDHHRWVTQSSAFFIDHTQSSQIFLSSVVITYNPSLGILLHQNVSLLLPLFFTCPEMTECWEFCDDASSNPTCIISIFVSVIYRAN